MSESKGTGTGGLFNLWRHARNPPRMPDCSFAGSTVLVTGANSGLDFAAAFKFASLGADSLILGVRSLPKGEAAKRRIISSTSIIASKIIVLELNCESSASVREFSNAVSTSTRELHVALLNAGVARPSYSQTPEGWEMTLQVNVLATAQLALNLLPKMRETWARGKVQPVLEIVGSEAYLDVKGDWFELEQGETLLGYLNDRRFWRVDRQYHVSKLLVMFIQQGIITALEGDHAENIPLVLVTSPGMCKTNIGRDLSLGMRVCMAGVQAFIATTAEEGSRSLVSGAVKGIEDQGKF